jgi:hypothetical protein
MGGDKSVGATFEAVPPPPADECAGLVPNSLPSPVVVQMPESPCTSGTSDDGVGNYMLGYQARVSGTAISTPSWQFFAVQNGQATRIGTTTGAGRISSARVFSQPSGFSVFHLDGLSGASTLETYSHEGTRASTHQIDDGGSRPFPWSTYASDPSGGGAALRHYQRAEVWVTTYQRFDKAGNAESDEIVVLQGVHQNAIAVGIALSGHALVMTSPSDGVWQLRWVGQDGAALTDWFTVKGGADPVLRFLVDGSIALGFPEGGWEAIYKAVIRDGVASADPLPAWLQKHNGDSFAVIRGGRGYGTWGPFSTACNQVDAAGMEVLSTSGKSCGCVTFGDISSNGSVGRDGSVIIPVTFAQPSNRCEYRLYPQLFK